MKLSTRSRYGLRLMVSLGKRYEKSVPIMLSDVAKEQDISEKYLSLIIILLKSAKFVTAFRGAKGGYSLSRHPSEISVKGIIQTLEGDLTMVPCVARSKVCKRSSRCITQKLWSEVHEAIVRTLDKYTLHDLLGLGRYEAFEGIDDMCHSSPKRSIFSHARR